MRRYPNSEIEGVYLSLPGPLLAQRTAVRLERLKTHRDVNELIALGRVLADVDPHKKTRALLEKASEGKLDAREAKKAADELVAHMVIEEHVFYPRVRQLMKDMVGESFEEHTVARFALARALMARGEENEI